MSRPRELPPLPVIIRSATELDLASLSRLNAAFNQVPDDPQALADRFHRPDRVEIPLIAESDGLPVGFAAVRIVPGLFYPVPHAELTELYVEPDHRQTGVGRALVRAALKLAAERSAPELWVLTGVENQAARKLYREMGFQEGELALVCKIEA